jgi:hypothetical protein
MEEQNTENKNTKHNIDWNIKLLLTSRRFSGRSCCSVAVDDDDFFLNF